MKVKVLTQNEVVTHPHDFLSGYTEIDQRKRKRETDRERSQTRVNIGPAFSEWGELRETEACKTDADPAVALVSIFGINCV